MTTGCWRSPSLWLAGAVALLLASAAGAGDAADRDSRELSSYRLTEAALAKYTQAHARVAELGRQSADDRDDDADSNGHSIDQLVANLDANAQARAAIQAAGMTTREYVVFFMSLYQAGMASWALQQPGAKLPPGVAMENVNFYRKHEAALKQLGASAEASAADD